MSAGRNVTRRRTVEDDRRYQLVGAACRLKSHFLTTISAAMLLRCPLAKSFQTTRHLRGV